MAGRAVGALRALLADGRFRELVVTRIDGLPIAASPFRGRLLEAGFAPGYRGLVLRPAGVTAPRSVVSAFGRR